MTFNRPQPPSFRYPFALDKHPKEIQDAHIWAFNAVLDLQKANAALKTQLSAIAPSTTSTGNSTTVTNNTTTTIEDILSGLGTVNDKTGVTTYTTQTSDAGALLILNDASPVAVTLNSVVTPPFALFITNFGAGLVTLTPTSGTINGGASLALLQNQSIWAVYTGTNWLTDAFTAPPLNSPAVATKFLTAYASATGVFSNAQPAFTDISGQITTAQLPASGLSVTITTAQLTTLGTQGSMTFVDGLLTAQTPAT